MGSISWISQVSPNPYQREAERALTTEKKVATWRPKQEVHAGFDNGADCKPRNTRNTALDTEKDKESDSPLEPPEGQEHLAKWTDFRYLIPRNARE